MPSLIILKKAGIESVSLIQEILDEVPTYMFNAEGVSQSPTAATEALRLIPDNCTLEQKTNLLVYQDNSAIGFVDILRDHPENGVANLGLLVIRESQQKKSLGRQTFQLVEKYIIENLKSHKIRLGVNENNPVQGFWEKMGFIPTGEIKPYIGIARTTSVIVMEKVLPSSLPFR